MMMYNDIVTTHFFSPRNVTPQHLALSGMCQLEKGEKSLGDWVFVTFQCNEAEEILYFTYKVFGHPFLIAGLSVWSEYCRGKTLVEVSQLSHQTLIQDFAIPKNKQYLALFLEDLLRDMVKTWREEHGER